MMGASEMTPCAVMFDVLKRCGHIKNNELAELVLSGRPLADGRSPASRAGDRSWVSRFVVHAPVISLQPRYFTNFSTASRRITNRLRSRRGKALTDQQIIDMVCGDEGRAMDQALAACHQSASLYRNALERLAAAEGHTPGERADAVMLLFVAAGCSANARAAVEFTMGNERLAVGMHTSTPSSTGGGAQPGAVLAGPAATVRPLGLLRVQGGYIVSGPHWVNPDAGVEVGALAMGDDDVTDVAADVSGRHARVWRDDAGRWLVCDLGSRNGTTIVDGSTGERREVRPGEPVELRAGDELCLGSATTFVVVEGAATA